MDQVGPGVYLISDKMPHPRDIPALAIQGSLESPTKEGIAEVIVRLSKSHDAWCGVSLPQLTKGMQKHERCYKALPLRQAIEEMVRDGLLRISGFTKWYARWLNAFSTPVVCPTILLVNKILANK